MHASYATNSLRPSLCTTNLRHIHFPHTVSLHPSFPTLLTRAHVHSYALTHACCLALSSQSSLTSGVSRLSTRDAQPFTALAHSLTHSLRARRRHCTRPLAHPLAHPLATCSTTSLHSPTRSPTRYVLDDCVIDDVTTLAHSLTHSLRDRRRHYTHPLAHSQGIRPGGGCLVGFSTVLDDHGCSWTMERDATVTARHSSMWLLRG
jgi:hypothetical protein